MYTRIHNLYPTWVEVDYRDCGLRVYSCGSWGKNSCESKLMNNYKFQPIIVYIQTKFSPSLYLTEAHWGSNESLPTHKLPGSSPEGRYTCVSEYTSVIVHRNLQLLLLLMRFGGVREVCGGPTEGGWRAEVPVSVWHFTSCLALWVAIIKTYPKLQ